MKPVINVEESFAIRSRFLLSALLLVIAHARAQQPRLPEGAQALRDLACVEGGHDRQKLDLFLPEKADAPRPVIVWVHGGAWYAGSKADCPALRFVGEGYAVASVGYRLSQHAVFPAQIEDCKAAIRWLRAHAKEYALDPQRIGVWGASAGGHLVALLGTSGDVKEFDVGANLDQSSAVQAVCDWFGPTDLTAMAAHALPGAKINHDAPDAAEAKLIGGAVQENKAKAARANPIVYASRNDAPFLIMHGDRDPIVPFHQSQLLFDAMKLAGASVHLHTIHGAGHGGAAFDSREIGEMVAAFFDERLKRGVVKVEALATESTASR